MAGRVAVRSQLASFISSPQITNVNQVFTSFPKRINFQVNSTPGQLTRSAIIVYISRERENRLAIGGANDGIKRIDYSVVLQVYVHSLQNHAENAMADFDTIIDNIKTRLRSDHTFGDSTGTLIWQGAEPVIDASYGEPRTLAEGATEIYAELQFDVTQMIHA